MRNRVLAAALFCAALAAASHAEAPVAHRFDLTLALSDKLVAELTAKNETIIIAAYFYGEPNEKGATEIDEMGQIRLGEERTEIPPAPGPVPINGLLDPGKLTLIEGGASVNVNIFSGRKSSEDNLISCDFIDGPVAELTAQPTEMFCGLITEDPVTSMKPAKG